jgi:hypothetical protein
MLLPWASPLPCVSLPPTCANPLNFTDGRLCHNNGVILCAMCPAAGSNHGRAGLQALSAGVPAYTSRLRPNVQAVVSTGSTQ